MPNLTSTFEVRITPSSVQSKHAIGGVAMHRLVPVVFLLAVATTLNLAQAAVPAFIPYSGRLSDGTAWGQSTTLDLVLTLYDAEVGGAVVFQGKHQDAQVVDGYFTVNLGTCGASGYYVTNPAEATFPSTLPDALWLAWRSTSGPSCQEHRWERRLTACGPARPTTWRGWTSRGWTGASCRRARPTA
jgi:hypothetical protein